MIKVILEAAGDRMVDLLPESCSVRETLDWFHVSPAGMTTSANGEFLQEEGLDRSLREFSEDAEVRIISAPAPAVTAGETAASRAIVLSDSEAELVSALQEIQEALNRAFSALGVRLSEEPPF